MLTREGLKGKTLTLELHMRVEDGSVYQYHVTDFPKLHIGKTINRNPKPGERNVMIVYSVTGHEGLTESLDVAIGWYNALPAEAAL